MNDFMKGYQPRTNMVNDEKGDLVADSYSIFARWRNHFSQLLNIHGVNDVRQTEIHTAEPLVPERNIHGVNDVRQTEIHTAEPLVPERSAFEVELAT